MTDAAFWNRLAATYAAKPVENPDAFQRKIDITRSLMTREDVVLDVGCGTGTLALKLAPSAAHIHGIDLAQEMTRIAETKSSAHGVDNVTFHTGPFDETFTAIRDGSLDGVCAYSFLHLLTEAASGASAHPSAA